MKRFILKLILLILPIVFGLIMCEYLLRKIPNDYSYKSQWLQKNSASVKILNLGSSHAFYGINPDYFSLSAFNLAHVSQSLNYDNYLLTHYLSDLDSLEYLILPISYFSLIGNLDNGIESWRAVNYSIYYDCNFHKWNPKYNLKMMMYGREEKWKKAKKSAFGQANECTCTKLGWGTSNKNPQGHLKESAKEAAKRHTHSIADIKQQIEKNKYYVENICSKCQEKNIQILILTTPTHLHYRNLLDSNQLQLMTDFCSKLPQQYPNVHYINLLEDPRFDDSDFYDADHLDSIGAIKLTKILNDTIIHFAHDLDSLQIISVSNSVK